MFLYKYANIDRLDIMANRSVRFTPVAAFNDPFDAPIPQLDNDTERVRFRLVDRIVASFIGMAKSIEEATRKAKREAESESGSYLVEMLESYLENLSADGQNLLRGSKDWKKLLSLAKKADLHNEKWGEEYARCLLALDSALKAVTPSGLQPLFTLITSMPPPSMQIDEVSVSFDPDQLKALVAAQMLSNEFSYLSTADLNRLVNHLGVLSLTTDPFNLLMWAHYGGEHMGIVIGLDIDLDRPSAIFGRNESDVTRAIDLRPVRYGTHRPLRHLDTYNAIDFIFTKSIDWRYENEWRAVALLSSADDVVNTGSGPVHLFNIEPTVIRRIIFGARVSNSNIIEKCEALGLSKGALNNIAVEKMHIDPLEFKLNAQPVDFTKLDYDGPLAGDELLTSQ